MVPEGVSQVLSEMPAYLRNILAASFLCLSPGVNNLACALKKNQFMQGMEGFWIADAVSSAAGTSPDDSGRLPRVRITHHPAVGE